MGYGHEIDAPSPGSEEIKQTWPENISSGDTVKRENARVAKSASHRSRQFLQQELRPGTKHGNVPRIRYDVSKENRRLDLDLNHADSRKSNRDLSMRNHEDVWRR